jgi:hypothetical protein
VNNFEKKWGGVKKERAAESEPVDENRDDNH